MDIQQEVRTFIANDLGREVERVTDGDSLLEGGILDSLGVLSLVGFIEKHDGIIVSEDEMMPENFDSIDAIAAFVNGRRSSRARNAAGARRHPRALGLVARGHPARAGSSVGMGNGVSSSGGRAALRAEEIARALDEPIAAPPVEAVVRGKTTVAIAIDDLSRPVPASLVLEPLVARLEAAGIRAEHITIVAVSGAHRRATRDDLEAEGGSRVAPTCAHRRTRPERLARRHGRSLAGVAVRINAAFWQADVRVGVCGVLPHPFAGFSGGGKYRHSRPRRSRRAGTHAPLRAHGIQRRAGARQKQVPHRHGTRRERDWIALDRERGHQ